MKIVRNEIFQSIKIKKTGETYRYVEYLLSKRHLAIQVRLDRALLTSARDRSGMLKNQFRMAALLLNENHENE